MQKYTLSSGKVIKIVPELEYRACTGCVGKKYGPDCAEIVNRVDCNTGVIAVPYVEEAAKSDEQKYTVKEVLTAYAEFSGVHIDSVDIVSVQDELKYKMDPEYQEYLRLKEKFENED
jgi:hypothetical protein